MKTAMKEVKALIEYAANAPATDPDEGWWDDLETAFTCGSRAERYSAAVLIRMALASLGFDAPTGVALCPGCSQEQESGEHDSDCEYAS